MFRASWNIILPSEQAVVAELCRCLHGKASQSADWNAILVLANRTLTTPSLASALLDFDWLPDDLAAFLETIRSRTLLRNRLMFAQLVEAVDSLATRGIKPIVLKGAAPLATRGETLDDRLFVDLDLMVPFEQAQVAKEALEAIGYHRDASSASWLEGQNFCRERDAGGIDLHYHLKSLYPRYSYADLVSHCHNHPIGNAAVWMPSPELQTAILILHDQIQERDYWRGLIDFRHLVDIWAIHKTCGGIDWAEVTGFFPAGTARRALHTQLLTLSELFDVPVPANAACNRVARIQLRRRFLQLRFKPLASIATLLTLLADPFSAFLLPRPSGGDAAVGENSLRSRLRVLRRMFLAPKPNKL